MGATNTTTNYSLSQFIGTDKPAWLQDYNGDMLKIDSGINAAKVAADGAQNAASAAQNDATTANNAITNTITPAISSLNTTVGNQGGAINTINSLIGNGTPTTTDQTIIGAINEINAKVNWTPAGTSTGTTPISLPANFNELLVYVINTSGLGAYTMTIPKDILSNNNTTFEFGNGITENSVMYGRIAEVNVSLTEVTLVKSAWSAGNSNTDITNSTTVKVYYK